ncbi:hypothetical protein DSECCO2_415970 [anaerobic digester metagenome]
MKKQLLILVIALMAGVSVFAQSNKKSIEVLYFKATLACCKAKACNMLESEIQAIIEKNFTDGSVLFKEVKLADDSNKVLVEKYKAQSQTVVLVKKRKGKEISADISDLVKQYLTDKNKEKFEADLVEKINAFKKQK